MRYMLENWPSLPPFDETLALLIGDEGIVSGLERSGMH